MALPATLQQEAIQQGAASTQRHTCRQIAHHSRDSVREREDGLRRHHRGGLQSPAPFAATGDIGLACRRIDAFSSQLRRMAAGREALHPEVSLFGH